MLKHIYLESLPFSVLILLIQYMEFCQRIELYQQNKSTLLQSLPFTKREDAENVNVFQLFQTISEENLFNISPVKYLFTCVTCNVYPVKCNVFL